MSYDIASASEISVELMAMIKEILKWLKGVQYFISIQAAFSLFLSVFLSFFLNLSCTQYQHAYKNVLFIIFLSKMSNIRQLLDSFFVIS